jgi:CelD/BcsL family acetyltransferase involved in cellulose biosynthesis
MVKQPDPPVGQAGAKDHLLGSEIIHGAAAAEKIIAEGNIQERFPKWRQLCWQAGNLAGPSCQGREGDQKQQPAP